MNERGYLLIDNTMSWYIASGEEKKIAVDFIMRNFHLDDKLYNMKRIFDR